MAVTTKDHDLTVNNHSPFDLIYLNATDRIAGNNETRGKSITVDMIDPPRKALQLDDYTEWLLINNSPITWVRANGL